MLDKIVIVIIVLLLVKLLLKVTSKIVKFAALAAIVFCIARMLGYI